MFYCRTGPKPAWLLDILFMAAVFCAVLTAVSSDARAETDFNGEELQFLTWSDYMDPEIIKDFEARFNAKVRFTYFESDQLRTEMLATTNGHCYDLILVSGADLRQYVKRDWLAPLAGLDIPNRDNIQPRWPSEFPQARDYGAPFFWGTIGIAYRRDLVPAPITSWRQLLEPAPELRGKIIMNKDARELIGVALLALGHSQNSSDPDDLRDAEKLLLAQSPSVQKYTVASLTEDSPLVTGEAWAAMVYNGDALMLREHSDQIVYAQPTEGSHLWMDYLAIAASSKHKALAAAFINFLNDPDIAARLAAYVYYATPNVKAKALLPPDYFSNPIIFPPQDKLDRMAFHAPLTPRATKFTNALMSHLLNQHQTPSQ